MDIIYQDMGTYAFRLFSDEIPNACTFPWISSTPGMWLDPPGPLGDIQKNLWQLVKNTGNDDALFVEGQYGRKWRPRNVKLGNSVYDMIQDLRRDLIVKEPDWRGQTHKFDIQTIKRILKIAFKVEDNQDGIPAPLHTQKPVKTQAAIGCTFDVTTGHLFRGHKETAGSAYC
jgi:hypothetical protein